MPDAIITSTASTFGTISGTFAADQSTVTGTVTGIVAGTLSGSVGVPGPAGAGVPAGGTAGQFLQKIDGTNYNTDWVTLNLSGYAPLASPAFTGNPTGPTAALGDNDTSLATTAFVQQELLSGTANAKNLEVYVRNQTGSTLAAGAIVYINGATGNRPTVTLAQANNDANSAQTMGFVKTAIAHNGFGYVIVRGECENLDTSAVAEGTQLYLSPTVAGAYTTTKPSAPQHLVYVGIVIRSHPTQGVILVAVQNGYELNELHDVSITSPTNGQVLKYNSTTGLWYNGTDSAGVAWGGITGTLSSQTDLQTALDGKYSTTNPAGYITSSALTGYATETFVTSQGYITSAALSPYATLASPALTGNVSITTNSTSPALFIEQSGTGNILTLHDQASDTTFVAIDQSGKIGTIASTTANAGFNIPHGTAPTTPVNGDIWTTTGNVFVRLNGGTQALANLGGNNVFTNANNTFGNSTATGTIGLASGATISGSTKTVNIGTGGVAGSTTNIAIGSTTGTSTTTLQGITNGVTQSAGDSSLKLATTAFVTTAVPAIATFSESQQLASTTKVMSPYDVLLAMMTEGYRPALGMTGGSSGTGAGVNPIMPQYMGIGGPNAGVAGSCHAITNNFGSYSTASTSGQTIKWNKPVCLSGTFSAFASFPGDSNNEFKLFLGPQMLNGNDPTSAAIGLWKLGGTSTISVMVHNGTTLTKVASSGTYGGSTPIRYLIYSDGAGNVTLYINGTQVATTALGPTGSTQTNTGQFTASILQTASAATRYYIELVHPKIFVAPQ